MIFKNFKEFSERKNKKTNGCSREFLDEHYKGDIEKFDKDNKQNWNCWNCRNCEDCWICRNCEDCWNCWNCRNCGDCRDCRDCWNCNKDNIQPKGSKCRQEIKG